MLCWVRADVRWVVFMTTCAGEGGWSVRRGSARVGWCGSLAWVMLMSLCCTGGMIHIGVAHGVHASSHGVVVITLDFESSDRGSNPCGRFLRALFGPTIIIAARH